MVLKSSHSDGNVDCGSTLSDHHVGYHDSSMVHDVRPSAFLSAVILMVRPSQLSREELGAALVSGLKSEGMMAFANPAFTNASSQAYAAQYVSYHAALTM